ncbi:hypothetical protein FA13DRAFT_1743275 [Coprinellus micaceus]|uniref:Uncharacterized protein n=1 Tax=Coprinellus micaceus TaxID=71717 RepID=A0A4Y7SEC6_COPMI|nr:hypothetical protein FA13DRAFT_1743275 [Coprinellus micaceus]
MSECPILVWMLSLNREYTVAEYDQCFKLVEECIGYTKFPYQPRNEDSFRAQNHHSNAALLMMRHRTDTEGRKGKHWIEQLFEEPPLEKFNHSMIGYHLAISNSLCGMAMTQGERQKVVNIGLGIIQYADSYMRAVGQPIGFDHARIDFDVVNGKAQMDGKPLIGWEFRVFTANLGVARGTRIVHEQYECVCAFFRGPTAETKFIWHQTPRELESWVQFINIDQMVKVIPKLTA